MSDLFAQPMHELQERFILDQFADPKRFARSDIDAWLDTQSEADVPDCTHIAQMPDLVNCLWCRITRWDILRLTDMPAAETLLNLSVTSFSRLEHTPQLVVWAPHFKTFLSSATKETRFYIGRDRFVVTKSEYGTHICSMDADVLPEHNDAMISHVFGNKAALTSVVMADLLLAEWIHRRVHAHEARAFLVGMLRHQVHVERVRISATFDADIASNMRASGAIQPTQH